MDRPLVPGVTRSFLPLGLPLFPGRAAVFRGLYRPAVGGKHSVVETGPAVDGERPVVDTRSARHVTEPGEP